MGRTTKKVATSNSAKTRKKSSSKETLTKKSSKTNSAKTAKTKSKKRATKKKGICFVLMPFKDPFDTYYVTIIKPAVIAAGLECQRGDSLFRPSPIMGDIWEMIQKAQVLVAELTEKNANVFYELGLGHAIGKPIVLISETIEDVPFDLRPLRVIFYDKDNPAWGNKLRTDLTSSLQETLQDPAEAVPSMFRKKVKSQAPEETSTETRLSEIERQLISIQEAGYRGQFSRADISVQLILKNFRDRIGKAINRQNAAEITAKVFEAGIPESIIRSDIKRYLRVSETEARAIIKLARNMHSPFTFTDLA